MRLIQAVIIGSMNRHLASSGSITIQRFDRINIESKEFITKNVLLSNPKIDISSNFVKVQTPFQFNINCTNINPVRCELFQKGLENAGKRIASILYISQTIVVDVSLFPFDDKDLIGTARSNTQFKVKVEDQELLFPQSLMKQLSTSQNLPFSEKDIIAQFNTDFDFFFRSNGAKIAKNQIDFELVACHEITHGLGFITGLQQHSSDIGTNNFLVPAVHQDSAYVSIFDAFISSKGEKLTRFAASINSFTSTIDYGNTLAERLYKLATSNKLEFKSKKMYVQLFSPHIFDQGSSISHLDQKFQGTDDFLMVPILQKGLDMDTITSRFGVYGVYGKNTRAIMNSMGWTTVFEKQGNIVLDFTDIQNIKSVSKNVFGSSLQKMDSSVLYIALFCLALTF